MYCRPFCFSLKNAPGLPSCITTAPPPIPKVSHSISKVLEKSSRVKTSACVNLSFNAWNACSCSSSQVNFSFSLISGERGCQGAKVLYKSSIETRESMKATYVPNFLSDANLIIQTPALEETNCTGSGRIYLDQVIDTKMEQPRPL